MSEMPNETPKQELTPDQSADVIRYYHDGENAQSREKGWNDKVPLGQSAIHTTRSRESILPSGAPLLTPHEMGQGLGHIENPPAHRSKLTDEQLDRIVDTRNISYDDALRVAQGEGFDISDYQ